MGIVVCPFTKAGLYLSMLLVKNRCSPGPDEGVHHGYFTLDPKRLTSSGPARVLAAAAPPVVGTSQPIRRAPGKLLPAT